MSEKQYTGHTASEVIELMGMLAKQDNVHSSDEALSIARKGFALLKDQADEIERLRGLLTYFYNHGYGQGHHDTVEARYVDLVRADMYTYHEDIVAEIYEDITDD